VNDHYGREMGGAAVIKILETSKTFALSNFRDEGGKEMRLYTRLKTTSRHAKKINKPGLIRKREKVSEACGEEDWFANLEKTRVCRRSDASRGDAAHRRRGGTRKALLLRRKAMLGRGCIKRSIKPQGKRCKYRPLARRGWRACSITKSIEKSRKKSFLEENKTTTNRNRWGGGGQLRL